MLRNVRIVPVTILVASLLVGLKVGDIWSGVVRLVGVANAEAQAQQKPADRKHAATGAPTNIVPAAATHAETGAGAREAEAAGKKPVGKTKPVQTAAAGDAAKPALGEKTAATQTAATEAGDSLPVLPPTPTAVPAEPPPAPPPPPRDPSTFSKAELEVLQNLAKRRDALDAQARDVAMREAVLSAAARKVDEKINELKQIQAKIQSLLIQHDEQDEKQLQSLVKVYQNMKPKDAARIFEKLDMPVLLDVVERMKEAKLAPILADMDPAKAKSVTTELATKRKLPREMAKGG